MERDHKIGSCALSRLLGVALKLHLPSLIETQKASALLGLTNGSIGDWLFVVLGCTFSCVRTEFGTPVDSNSCMIESHSSKSRVETSDCKLMNIRKS